MVILIAVSTAQSELHVELRTLGSLLSTQFVFDISARSSIAPAPYLSLFHFRSLSPLRTSNLKRFTDIWTDTLTTNTKEMRAYNWRRTRLAHAIPVSELCNRRHVKPFGTDTIHTGEQGSDVTNKTHPATNVVLLTAALFFLCVSIMRSHTTRCG